MADRERNEYLKAMESRHSVRRYKDQPLTEEVKATLMREVKRSSEESGLDFRLVTDEPEAFGNLLAHYGRFENVQNYIAVFGEKNEESYEKTGYYGERIVLESQLAGLNTCWVAASCSKKTVRKQCGREDLLCVIALGYGAETGKPHKSKPLRQLYKSKGNVPLWFNNGVKAASLAPTAMNQQKFCFTFDEDAVKVHALHGFYVYIDLGIVRFHFEAATGRKVSPLFRKQL